MRISRQIMRITNPSSTYSWRAEHDPTCFRRADRRRFAPRPRGATRPSPPLKLDASAAASPTQPTRRSLAHRSRSLEPAFGASATTPVASSFPGFHPGRMRSEPNASATARSPWPASSCGRMKRRSSPSSWDARQSRSPASSSPHHGAQRKSRMPRDRHSSRRQEIENAVGNSFGAALKQVKGVDFIKRASCRWGSTCAASTPRSTIAFCSSRTAASCPA